MPARTTATLRDFASLQYSIRKARNELDEAISAATAAGDVTTRNQLLAQKQPLRDALQEAIELEISYYASATAPSDAEAALTTATNSARAVARGLNAVANVLTAAGKFATILARLAAVL